MDAAAKQTALVTKPLTRRERSAASTYRKIQKAQERASAQYELADRLSFKLGEQIGAGKVARISVDGKGIQAIDNYQAAIQHPKREPGAMPKAWAHGCVRQYDFKEINVIA